MRLECRVTKLSKLSYSDSVSNVSKAPFIILKATLIRDGSA